MRCYFFALSHFFVILALVVSPLCFVSANAYAEATARQQTLVVGVISSNPKKAFKRTQPFADFLADRLSKHGITKGEVVVSRDIRQMARWLSNGRVDLVSETVFSAQELIDHADAELLARRWKSNAPAYRSIFFSRRGNEVNALGDLRGKTVVFEDRGSTSAFLVPAAILLEQGYELYELSSPREHPPEDKVGYFFSDEYSKSGGETNMMSWVHRNIVAAAAFSNLDWEKEIPKQVKQQLQIIHVSRDIPRSLMLIRSDLSVDIKQSILNELLSAHQTAEGQKALRAYKKTKKFDAITPEIEQSIRWAETQRALVDDRIKH